MTISEIDEQLENLREQICYLIYDRPNEGTWTLDKAVDDDIRRERLEAEYRELEDLRLELTREDESSFDGEF